MSSLLSKPSDPDADGNVQHITPETAGWGHVGFDMHHLAPDQVLSRNTGDREVCLVIVSGRATIKAGGEVYEDIGERLSVFEQKAPYAVYAPNGTDVEITALSDLELAVASAPGKGSHAVRLIRPEDIATSTRGDGTNTRHVYDILPESEPADSLLVVEVITPSGSWSSYPPHKHDTHTLPDESFLEETYYHRLNPPQGFAFQRVYTDDRSLDETMAVHDGDVVMVPKGYHPVGAPHGYDLYYLNVMAGPERIWRFRNDPDHDWIAPQKK